ncbi:hybrid sensor histidine kinase/response regulator transcription factor [Filimonas effusa]|nr:two-component regulator propeller domain-containing protein [Filimonas effusa]
MIAKPYCLSRHKPLLLFSCFYLVFVLFYTTVKAQSNPPFSLLGNEQGLSNNTVRSIFQDHNGFMWMGTFDGLNRYDGYDFKVFRNKQNDTGSLVHNIILAITEDSLHHLWIGTRQGLSRLSPLFERFQTVRLAGNGNQQALNCVIKDLRSDKQSNLFIATEGNGLLVCPNATLLAQPIPLIANNTSVLQYSVKAVRCDLSGNVWALIPKYGLARYDRQSRKLVLINTALPDAGCLEVKGNMLMIASNTALYYYTPQNNQLVPATDYRMQQPSAGGIVCFSIDEAGMCWIGTTAGRLLAWNTKDANATCTDANISPWPIKAAGFHAIYIDGHSRKWIGTARDGVGIIDVHKSRFHTVTAETNGQDFTSVISALYEAPDGKLFMGTDGEGISIWDRVTNKRIALKSVPGDAATLSDNAITGIKADSRQHTWITTFRQGVSCYHAATGKIERYKLINSITHTEDKVTYGLLADRNNRVWVSTLRQNSSYGALYLFNDALNSFELFDNKLSDLFTLYEDRNGDMWGGNLNQLVKIDRVNKKHVFYPIGHAVRGIYEDSKGNLWLGTEGGGLQLFDRKRQQVTTRYTVNEGLCSDVVLTLLEEGNGRLWVSTVHGLARIDISQHSIQNYYQTDGLQSNQFHYNSALALRSGELAFGGIKGMNIFRPAGIRGEHLMPPLRLTDLTINNTPVTKDSGAVKNTTAGTINAITVPYSEAVLGFRFTALEYSAPGKISYAYYMDGWDRSWNYTGNLRSALYTHLDEGTYTFRVKSTNGEGEWNLQELAIRVVVLPPWYRSWWAYLLYAGCALGGLYLLMGYRIRQNRLQYEIKVAQLQAQQAELKTQKEKEVNEKRLAFFTNISHEFRTPLTLIIDPVKEMLKAEEDVSQKNELNMVYRNARRLLSLVDQLLLFRKAESGADNLRPVQLNAVELCREVFFSFVQQARIKKIDYQIHCPEEELLLWADREKLEIILYNLLSNAIKFTPAGGQIVLQLTSSATAAEITITDNGPGIPAKTGEKLFHRFYQVPEHSSSSKSGFGIGLYLVKHFVQLHKGQISYESEPGKGTRFHIHFLKGTAHLGGQEIYGAGSKASLTGSSPDSKGNASSGGEATSKRSSPEDGTDLYAQSADITTPQENHPAESGAAFEEMPEEADKGKELVTLVTEIPTLLVVDDDEDLRRYVSQVFSKDFNVLQAINGEEGLQLAEQYLPNLIISDITMEALGGVELCRRVKENPSLTHIPVILLTATTASEIRLQGLEAGADDYITKPFEKELLKARAINLLKKHNSLQQFFYNEITLQKNDSKVSVEYREFLQKCIEIVEEYLDDETFSIKTLCTKMGMSRSSLYRKVNSVSGQSIVSFIRFIRLRKAAQMMIDTENNITEIASLTGFNDIKYFREHFSRLFGMRPSEYIKRFRKPFHNKLQVNKNIIKPD